MTIVLRRLGLCAYEETWRAMRCFADAAADDTTEEIWLLQHTPVYTLGKNGDRAHLRRAGDIPLVRSDRGGQITYHAPGQIVVYLLLNLKRRGIRARDYVLLLQEAIVRFLAAHGVSAAGDIRAPGVYINGAKIAALGIRLRRGWCYHGISVNIHLDLSPFTNINPCGYEGLPVTQLSEHTKTLPPLEALQTQLGNILVEVIEGGDRAAVL